MNFFAKHFGGPGRRSFVIAFFGSLATIFAFDLLWSMATSYRGLGFVSTYWYAATLAFVMALPAALRRRRRWPMAVVLVVADLLALANLMYCRTYLGPIPPSSYLLAGNVAQFGDAIIHSLKAADVVFPLITAATLLLMKRSDAPGVGRRTLLATAGVLFGGCLLIAPVYRTPFGHIRFLKGDCYYHATPPVAYTLPVSIICDAFDSSTGVTDEDKAAAVELLAEMDAMRTATPDSVRHPENVVFILVESLEGWTLGKSVEGKEITPNLNRLTADTASTWVATRVLSQVGPGRSIDGQLLMTAGLFPLADGAYSMHYGENTYPHLNKVLKHNGIEKSYLISGDRATTWNEGAMAMRFGIDERRFRDSWEASESFGRPRNPSDGSLVRQAIGKMKSGEIWPVGERAFVELITYSSHFPFFIPEDKRHISLGGSYPEPLGDYITAINYTDRAIGELVDYIQSRPDADRTMIVIAGDHEALAAWRSGIRGASPETAALVDAESYVPLIILNAPHPGRREAVMGQIDVYPTVLGQAGIRPSDASGLDASSFPGLGVSALSPTSPPYAVDLSGIIAGDTVGADPRMLRAVLSMPRASSVIIRADMMKEK